MRRTLSVSPRRVLLLGGLLAVMVCLGTHTQPLAWAKGKAKPNIAPPQSHPYGMSYAEWAAAWWQWAIGIPFAEHPLFDATGEFADVDQEGQVWFLAGNFGGVSERTITVPTGKSLLFPLLNYVYWGPQDLPLAIMVAESLGIDPTALTDEELLRLLANFSVDGSTALTLTIDGVEIQDLDRYRTESPAFTVEDADLLDDFGVPPSESELFVAAGYWIMLRPLSVGEHTIQFKYTDDSPIGTTDSDVTYHITVAPGRGD